jgi:hypothetical protein
LVAAWPSTRKARAATTAPAPTAEVAGK